LEDSATALFPYALNCLSFPQMSVNHAMSMAYLIDAVSLARVSMPQWTRVLVAHLVPERLPALPVPSPLPPLPFVAPALAFAQQTLPVHLPPSHRGHKLRPTEHTYTVYERERYEASSQNHMNGSNLCYCSDISGPEVMHLWRSYICIEASFVE
jgi:hypothetical protein